jgi:hypothetical protein
MGGGVPEYRVGRTAGKRKRQTRERNGDSGIEEKCQKGFGGGGGFHHHSLVDSNELVLVAVAAESIVLDQW